MKKSNSLSSSSSFSVFKPVDSTLCCCRSSNSSDSSSSSPSSSSPSSSSSSSSSLSPLQQFLSSAAQAIEDFANSLLNSASKKDGVVVRDKLEEGNLEVDVDGWNWERWSLHFKEVEEQERLIKLLKVILFFEFV